MQGGKMVEAFRFAVLNDLHYMDVRDGPWLEGLVARVNGAGGGAGGKDPELCLVLGDLAETGSRTELSAAREILGGLRMPYYVVPGNHDGPPGRLLGTFAGGLEVYQELFPGRRNYTFEHKGWQFVALDSTDGSEYIHVPLNPEAKRFAREAAARLDPGRPVVLFTHFPVAPEVPYTLSDGPELLAIFRGVNLRIVFSGHYHGRTRHMVDGVKAITNTCGSMRRELEADEKCRGYMMCDAGADGVISHEFVEYRGSGGG
jgi:predicted MPP superfamily phosphohydrolase